jgi:hydroxypyruvate reductase
MTATTAAGYRRHVKEMVRAALAAADPASAVQGHLRREGHHLIVDSHRYDLRRGRLLLIAVGKAALKMGQATLQILQGEIWAGLFITKQTDDDGPRRYSAEVGNGRATVNIYEAGHPVSDERGLKATEAAIGLLRETRPGDLVLCLISGGASALLTRPSLTLQQWQQLIQTLLESGCTINELNSVRKSLDLVKGGGLAELAAPAATVSLILSDVVGNPLDVIGSGPTAANPDPPDEALTVLNRYNVRQALAPETWALITEQLTGAKTAISPSRFEQLEVKNVVVGDVRSAAQGAADAAQALGYQTELLTAYLEGEAREVGRVAAALARDQAPGSCYLLGGETTVTVVGEGSGGRNQELALAAAIALAGHEGPVVASFATDGEDGPTDAAGAVVSGQTIPQALSQGMMPRPYLERNDSHSFFNELTQRSGEEYLLRLGPTGTNVNDLLIIFSPSQS